MLASNLKTMIKRLISSIPNTITSFNLISGIIAIFFSFHYSDTFGCLLGYQWAFVAIAAAALFDFCDGASARLLHAYSPLGADLDSLADLVSFGVAPAMLLLNVLLTANDAHWASFIAIFIPVMGAFRLAKFNNDDTQKTSFSGLPIPANAIFWIGFTAFMLENQVTFGPWWTTVVVICISLLMVSRMRMFSLKFKNFDWRENFSRYVLILATIAFVIQFGVPGLMWTILFYILLSAVSKKAA